MKKYKVLHHIKGEETLQSGSPMTISELIESNLGKVDKHDYRIDEVRINAKNNAGDLTIQFFNTKGTVSEVFELIAPLQIVGELSDHGYVLETLAKLTFLDDLDHDRIVQIMEYPVEAGKVIKEDTLFNMFKWCGERIEAQSCGVGKIPLNA